MLMEKLRQIKKSKRKMSVTPFHINITSCKGTVISYEQRPKNVRLRHTNKFYKDINADIRLCQKLYNNCNNFGLRNFLGHYDP